MNTTITADWIPIRGSFEPRDQQADLHNGYWAEIGPDQGDYWSWAVYEATADGYQDDAGSGMAHGEEEAKAAVANWAEADLLSDQLAAEIAEGVLSEAFTRYGHNDGAVARAALAVAATDQIA